MRGDDAGEPLPAQELRALRARRGSRPGDRYVSVIQPFAASFRRQAPGHLIASEQVLQPSGRVGRAWNAIRQVVIGRRIPSEHELRERIGPVKGLAVFASDNISSSAYASEEIMRVVVAAGAGALALTMPLTVAIVVVLAVVVISYQQTIRAYPSGGGSYIVASDNLGRLPGLVAAAALLTDYVLTVAVSIAAGVAALTSIVPALFDWRVVLGVAFVAALWLGNLRGIRESANIFAIPTYVYLVAIYGLLGFGLWRFVGGSLPAYTPPAGWLGHEAATSGLSLLLILRAFASGSVALTGTEAVANGVPAFTPPESRHAGQVLILMGLFFGSIFIGISFLAAQLGVVPDPTEQETVISQIARTLVGAGTPYHYLIQVSTALLLVLAANTAFADFPRLASILGKDRYMPRQFAFRGDRLAFSVGIMVLALLAAVLIVAFGGSVTNLIPLYTVGVFVAFTLSQAGMVRHWYRLRHAQRGWQWRAGLNGAGAVATGLVAIIVGIAKFALGAWMILLLIPLLIGVMWAIGEHYRALERELATPWTAGFVPRRQPRVIVPISRMDRPGLAALAYARSISDDVTAVHVSDDRGELEEMQRRWEEWGGPVPLVILESPYRALLSPLLAYLDATQTLDPARPTTIVIAEFVPRHIWEYPLHNQTALRLKFRLFFRPNTVVTDVPYHVNGRDPGPGALSPPQA
jgi:amino acid transporter